MSQTCESEPHEKFHGGQEHVQDDEHLGRPSTSQTDAMLKILRRLSIRAIVEEVGIDKVTVRLGYQAEDRSYFSPFQRCDSLRDDWSARRPGRPPSPRETLCHPKTRVCDPGKFSYAFFNIRNVFAGVFFLFRFEVLLHDQLRRDKMTYTN